MGKEKIIEKAREKSREKISSSDGEKSFVAYALSAVMDIVSDAKDDDGTQSARDDDKGGKVSGRKPRGQNNGRAASVGRSVADQLRGRK